MDRDGPLVQRSVWLHGEDLALIDTWAKDSERASGWLLRKLVSRAVDEQVRELAGEGAAKGGSGRRAKKGDRV